MRDKLTKFLAIIFLTLLIWTWAFLSQEKTRTFSGTLAVSGATDPSLLVTFWVSGKDWGQRIPLDLKFRGTPGKIAALDNQIQAAPPEKPQQNPMNYYYNPRDFNHTQTQFYPFRLLDFLQESSQAKGLALTLESCAIDQQTVNQIEVYIEVLVKKTLPVECVTETGAPVKAVVEPAQVEMYVRENYSQPARVMLSAAQIELARQRRIRSRPYVEMGTGQLQRAEQEVTITILKETVPLQARVFQPQPQNIGFVFSSGLQGKYVAQIDSESESKLRTIHLRATDAAYEAYKKMRYPILIEIREEDLQSPTGEIPPKEIIYNFPPEFVTTKEIELGEPRPPRTAVIKLMPITPAPAGP